MPSFADAAWHWLLFDVVLPHMVPADLETVALVRAELLRASWAALLATDGNHSSANSNNNPSSTKANDSNAGTVHTSSTNSNAGATNSSTINASSTSAGGKSTSANGTDGSNSNTKNKMGAGNSADSASSNAKGARVFAFFADVFADMCGKDAEIAKMLSSVDIEVRILVG